MDKLSFILIKYILTFLRNLDKIYFILTSKKFYENREKLITFSLSTDEEFLYHDDRIVKFKLKSFKRILCNSFKIIYLNSKRYDDHVTGPTTIILSNSYDQLLIPEPLYYIESIHTLYLSHTFNLQIRHLLPKSLKTLVLGQSFNQPINQGDLPESLTDLTLGIDFDQELAPSALSKGIIRLEFGYQYNQPLVVGSLPPACKKLIFGGRFNQNISVGVLPDSLTDLKFGASFNAKIETPGILPSSLTILSLNNNYAHPIPTGVLPPSLTELSLGYQFDHYLSLPSSLTSLSYERQCDFNHLAQQIFTNNINLKSLKTGRLYNQYYNMVNFTTLTSLSFGSNFQIKLQTGTLPPNLVYLELGEFNQVVVKDLIPNKVEQLVFGSMFNSYIDPGSLPSTLKSISFGTLYDQYLVGGVIPYGCHSIYFGKSFNHPIGQGVLPSTVKIIEFGHKFNQALERGVLKNVHSVRFGIRFNQVLHYDDDRDMEDQPRESLLKREKVSYSYIPRSIEHVEIFDLVILMKNVAAPLKTFNSLISIGQDFVYTLTQHSKFKVQFLDENTTMVINESTLEGGMVSRSKLSEYFSNNWFDKYR